MDITDEEQSDYCSICNSCGEAGCCSSEQSIMAHGCKHARAHAFDVYFDKIIAEEFYKYIDSIGAKHIIDTAYEKADKLANQRYYGKQ